MKHYWLRFVSEGVDARPITVPAPCQWWCSGYTSEKDAFVCALVQSETPEPWEALKKWWPGLKPDFIEEVEEDWKPGPRFLPKESGPNTWQWQVLTTVQGDV